MATFMIILKVKHAWIKICHMPLIILSWSYVNHLHLKDFFNKIFKKTIISIYYQHRKYQWDFLILFQYYALYKVFKIQGKLCTQSSSHLDGPHFWLWGATRDQWLLDWSGPTTEPWMAQEVKWFSPTSFLLQELCVFVTQVFSVRAVTSGSKKGRRI